MFNVSWYHNLASTWDQFSSVFVVGACGLCGQGQNGEIPHCESNVQDVTIEDLYTQVAKLTQHLVAQNLEMNNKMDR